MNHDGTTSRVHTIDLTLMRSCPVGVAPERGTGSGNEASGARTARLLRGTPAKVRR